MTHNDETKGREIAERAWRSVEGVDGHDYMHGKTVVIYEIVEYSTRLGALLRGALLEIHPNGSRRAKVAECPVVRAVVIRWNELSRAHRGEAVRS